MSYQVTLLPSGKRIEVAQGQRVLSTAVRAGVSLNYSCRLGSCETCVGRVVEGEVDLTAGHFPQHLLERNQVLLCQAVPLSDLVIEVEEAPPTQPPKTNKIMVYGQRLVAPDVMILRMRLPITTPLVFRAGQYVDLLLADGRRRSYSIASTPDLHGINDIELHVRLTPGGHFTPYVFKEMRVRDVMWFEGPLGSFFIRDDSHKPIILLASGTGFAPMQSIINGAIKANNKRPMTLYWGGRTRADLYALEGVQALADSTDWLNFVPVLSEARASDNWRGRTGFVHAAVMQDFPDLSAHQVYACGAPVMVDAARADFTSRCRLPRIEFFADAFIDEGTSPARASNALNAVESSQSQ